MLSVKCGGPFTMYSPSDPRTKENNGKKLVYSAKKYPVILLDVNEKQRAFKIQ